MPLCLCLNVIFFYSLYYVIITVYIHIYCKTVEKARYWAVETTTARASRVGSPCRPGLLSTHTHFPSTVASRDYSTTSTVCSVYCIHAGRRKNKTHLYLYMLIKGVIITAACAARWENADCGVMMMMNWVRDLA